MGLVMAFVPNDRTIFKVRVSTFRLHGLDEKIRYYLAHPTEAQEIAQAGQKRFMDYNAEAVTEFIVEFIF